MFLLKTVLNWMIADLNFSILVQARLSAVLILCICRSRGNVSGSVPALSSSASCGHSVGQWVCRNAAKWRNGELVKVKILNGFIRIALTLGEVGSVTAEQTGCQSDRWSKPLGCFGEAVNSTHIRLNGSKILLCCSFVPSRLWSSCISVNPSSSISNEGQLWGRRMRGGSSNSAKISQFSWPHLRLWSCFLPLLLSDVRSSGFNPVWEDEERKHIWLFIHSEASGYGGRSPGPASSVESPQQCKLHL